MMANNQIWDKMNQDSRKYTQKHLQTIIEIENFSEKKIIPLNFYYFIRNVQECAGIQKYRNMHEWEIPVFLQDLVRVPGIPQEIHGISDAKPYIKKTNQKENQLKKEITPIKGKRE